jgi:hypothetical protein
MKTLRTLIAPAILATLMLTSQVEAGVNYDSLTVTDQMMKMSTDGSFGWKATVENSQTDTAYFNVIVQFLDADGILVAKVPFTHYKLAPGYSQKLTDLFVIDRRIVPEIKQFLIVIEEDTVAIYLNGQGK